MYLSGTIETPRHEIRSSSVERTETITDDSILVYNELQVDEPCCQWRRL